MEYKKTLILTIFLLCNITARGETYIQYEYNKIEPLLSKQNLTEEDVARLVKFKKDCEGSIASAKSSIEYFRDTPIKNEQKPLTEYISESFADVFQRPQWAYGDYSGIGNMIETQRVIITYGLLPITAPAAFFLAVGQWWGTKNLRKHMAQRDQATIKLCEEYIKKIDAAIARTTSP